MKYRIIKQEHQGQTKYCAQVCQTWSEGSKRKSKWVSLTCDILTAEEATLENVKADIDHSIKLRKSLRQEAKMVKLGQLAPSSP